MYTSIPVWDVDPAHPLTDAQLTAFDYTLDDRGNGELYLTFTAPVKNLSPQEFGKLQQIAYQAIADYAANNGYETVENGSIGLSQVIGSEPEYFVHYYDEEDEDDDEDTFRWNPFVR